MFDRHSIVMDMGLMVITSITSTARKKLSQYYLVKKEQFKTSAYIGSKFSWTWNQTLTKKTILSHTI